MAYRYHRANEPIVTLPANPRWDENPLGDSGWQFRYQSLRHVLDLFTAWRVTGKSAYRDRALFLLKDWYTDNPRYRAPSIWSWNDHSTALRAVVFACAADLTPMTDWLHDALVLHGRTLADPSFYRYESNHALNQAIGLLELARVLKRPVWRDLAGDRINALIPASIDVEGVTNEQAVAYQLYNYRRYRVAAQRMLAVGLTPSPTFARLDLMPTFLAHATLPNGRYEMIGDTGGSTAAVIRGTWAEFAATKGASGPKPTSSVAHYAAGYLFATHRMGGDTAGTGRDLYDAEMGSAPRLSRPCGWTQPDACGLWIPPAGRSGAVLQHAEPMASVLREPSCP
jgi:hypothetical protein